MIKKTAARVVSTFSIDNPGSPVASPFRQVTPTLGVGSGTLGDGGNLWDGGTLGDGVAFAIGGTLGGGSMPPLPPMPPHLAALEARLLYECGMFGGGTTRGGGGTFGNGGTFNDYGTLGSLDASGIAKQGE